MKKKQIKILFIFFISLNFSADILSQTDVPRTMYVLQGWGANSISKMNMDNSEIQVDFWKDVGITPNEIQSHHHQLFLVNSIPDEIVIFDTRNISAEPASIAMPEGGNPWSIVFSDAATAYVTNNLLGSVSKIDLASRAIEKQINTGQAPQGMIIHDGYLYVANTGTVVDGWNVTYVQGTVDIIDLQSDSVIYTLNVPENPQYIAIDMSTADSSFTDFHVLCSGGWGMDSGRIAVLRRYSDKAPAIIDTIHIGGFPGDIIIAPNGKGYICEWGGDNGHVYIYDVLSREVLRGSDNPVLVDPGASSLKWDAFENCIWIAAQTRGTVQKFDVSADTVAGSWQFGLSSQSIAIIEPFTSVEKPENVLIDAFHLAQNYPNPFNPETRISFSLSTGSRVTLQIFNIEGRLINTLIDAHRAAGTWHAVWTGTDNNGAQVPSGIYIYKLESSGVIQTKRMALIR